MNLMRRQLTPSQASMVGAKAKELFEKEAKERQRDAGGDKSKGPLMENFPEALKGTARDKAGEAVGVSGRSIDFATKVIPVDGSCCGVLRCGS